MSKRIDYTEATDGTAQDAKDTIDTLATERENGNITDYSVEFRADVGVVQVHVWRDVSTTDDLPTGYDAVDAALSNAPVDLPSAADRASAQNRGRGPP